jgi:hypothetical protein
MPHEDIPATSTVTAVIKLLFMNRILPFLEIAAPSAADAGGMRRRRWEAA